MQKKFDVSGMTCASCQANVEKDVKRVQGVNDVTVSLLTNSMVVTYDESVAKPDSIIKAVKDGGYRAKLHNDIAKTDANPQATEIREMRSRLIISMIFFLPLLYISMGAMLGFPQPAFLVGMGNILSFAFMQMLLVIPIVFVNWRFFSVGYLRLWKRSPNMDSLIAIGSTAALLYGIYAIFQIGIGLGHDNMALADEYAMNLYFEAAGAILALVTLGKFLEALSKGRTGDAIRKLIDLAPKTAIILQDGIMTTVPVETVQVGDMVVVKPGMSIPVDGIITEGSSAIDEAAITGESMPAEKTVGDKVIAATINRSGSFVFRATEVGENTTLMQIVKLVENAQTTKAPIQKLADQVSGVFVPIVIVIALVTFAVWMIAGEGFSFALSMGITVLVISCPCALGLATPVAIMVGTGKGAEHGMLIKTAESLELAGKVTAIVLDKTGTITIGKPSVTNLVSTPSMGEDTLLQIMASIEASSEHPLAKAIVNEAQLRNLVVPKATDFQSLAGSGVRGIVEGQAYSIGNQRFVTSLGVQQNSLASMADTFSQEGKTTVFLTDGKAILGLVAMRDEVKPTSIRAIRSMKKLGLKVFMLTGDNRLTSEAIAKEIGIETVYSEVLPQDKEQIVRDLQSKGHKVAMVGDGVNDAIALVQSDVGIAIGAGTDVAIESASVVLIKNDLQDVVSTIELSRKTIANIKMNLFWAFFYNIIGIPIAAGLFYPLLGLKLDPLFGSLAMSLSSVTVVLNALRLKFFKPKFVD